MNLKCPNLDTICGKKSWEKNLCDAKENRIIKKSVVCCRFEKRNVILELISIVTCK